MGRRKHYVLTDTQADALLIAIVTYTNQLLDQADNGDPAATRTIAVLDRAGAALRRPVPFQRPGSGGKGQDRES